MRALRTSRRVVVAALLVAAWPFGADAAEAERGPELGLPGHVAVLDVTSGQELWSASPNEQVNDYSAVPGREVIVATTGVCRNEGLAATGLVVLDAATGRRRWENASAVGALATVRPLYTYVSAVVPVDAQGVVVAAGDTGLTGRRAEDGTAVWSLPAAEGPVGASEVSVFTTDRATGSLRAFIRRSGRMRWERDGWADPFTVVGADERHVVIATGEIQSQHYGQVTFVVLDARTGRELSRFDAGHPELFDFNDVALTDEDIVYAQRSSIVNRRLSDGKQNWRRRVDQNPGALNMARSTDNKTVFALRSGAVGRVVALDAATGHQRWTTTGQFADAGSNTTVVGRSYPGRTLRGVDTSTGATKWRYEVPPDLAPIGSAAFMMRVAGGRLAMSTECNDG